MPPLKHMEAKYCKSSCGLRTHVKSSIIPEESRMAWEMWNTLASPSVSRFGLQAEVFKCFDVRLSAHEFLTLLGEFDEIEAGIHEAEEALRKK